MKLHVYDHCPYCVRARMVFGLKAVPVELVFVPNDDEETPIRMIGRKMLPILEDGDGFLPESLDIVRKVDGLSGPRLFDGAGRPEIADWIARWSGTVNGLVIPRTPDPVFPEFATASARAYFTAKKEQSFGPFAELLGRTGVLTEQIGRALAELTTILPDPEGAGIDDILLFPLLRSLSIVPGLPLPPEVAHYRERLSVRSAVPLVDALRRAR